MDKITRIHIARVPYEISASGQELLHRYLNDIRATLDEALADEVMADVETRITEILSERGIKKNEVITSKDIRAVQERLGAPEQFGDDETRPGPATAAAPHQPRKLLRDPDGAYLGGVASGLGNYFGIDPIFVRLMFIALTFLSGVGIVAYILFWLLVPAAKSNSEKLQMAGQPVTVATLKRYRSTIEHELSRNPNVAQKTILIATRAVLLIIKLALSLAAAALILGLLTFIAASASFSLVEPFHSLVAGYRLDYVMLSLAWLVALSCVGLLVTALAALWSRRRELKFGVLIFLPLLIVSLVASTGIGVLVANHFGNQYGNGKTVKPLAVTSATSGPAPTRLDVSGPNLAITYVVSGQPLRASYQAPPGLGRPDVTVAESAGTVTVSGRNLTRIAPTCFGNLCRSIYLPLRVTVYGPVLTAVSDNGARLQIAGVNFGAALSVSATGNAGVTLDNDAAGSLTLTAVNGADIDAGTSSSSQAMVSADATSSIEAPVTSNLTASLPSACPTGQILSLNNEPGQTTVNGVLQTPTTLAANNCVQPLADTPSAPPAPPAP